MHAEANEKRRRKGKTEKATTTTRLAIVHIEDAYRWYLAFPLSSFPSVYLSFSCLLELHLRTFYAYSISLSLSISLSQFLALYSSRAVRVSAERSIPLGRS